MADISFDSAKNIVIKYGFCAECRFTTGDKHCITRDCYRAVKRLMEAVPVVRCKDCKHFKSYGRTSLLVDGKNIKAGWCNRRIRFEEEYRMLPDDFCSYGERKDGEG